MTLPFKIVLLLIAVLSQRIGIKPPNPPPANRDRVKYGTWFEKNPRAVAKFAEYNVNAYLLIECIVLLLPAGSPFLSTLCPRSESESLAYLSSLTPSFLLGVGIMAAAAALRLWCYQALGPFFTFEITTRRDHKLITSGPYAYVRHPAYTGSVLLIIGPAIIAGSSNSYVFICHKLWTPVHWFFLAWVPWKTYVAVSLLKRGKVEDDALKASFGRTWKQYSHAVPRRFIPGIV